MASRTYRVVLAGNAFPSRQHVSMEIGNHRLGIRDRHVGTGRQLGLKGGY
jgi:hypothetical protein